VDGPTATWNPARGVWETPALNMLCGQLVPFSGIWPRSGMMRRGRLFERLTPGHLTGGNAGSVLRGLLPTPRVSGGSTTMSHSPSVLLGKHGNDLAPVIGVLLKTPTAQLAVNGGSQDPVKRRAGGHGPTLADQVEWDLLPTSAARDYKSGRSGIMDRNSRPLSEVIETGLLPTPTARPKGGANCRHGDTSRGDDLPEAVKYLPTPTAGEGTGYMSGSNRDTWRPTLSGAVKGYEPVLHQGRPSPGASTSQRFAGGSTSSTGLRPVQLSLGEPENG
jgi:hypothetical protein